MKQYFSILAALLLCFGASSLKAQIVTIPDTIFKAYLLNTTVNANLDSEIQLSEAQNFTGGINLGGLNITDLTGLEEFINLTELDCRATSLTSLDFSANVMLTSLKCGDGILTSLVLSNNTNLTDLSCGTSPLTSLNLSNNINLTHLVCFRLKITELDLSSNINLLEVNCREDSLLTRINIKNGNNTSITSFSAIQNPALTCIEVDTVAYSTANWTNVDAGFSFSTNCFLNITTTGNIPNLQVYPNPTPNALTVDLGTVHSSVNITVSNTIGQRVQSATYTNTQTLDLNLDGLPGWYFIQIETEKGSQTIKVLKQ